MSRAMTAHSADAYAHGREPRRASDPPDSDWSARLAVAGGAGEDDREMGDMRRLWRSGRWVALVLGAALLVALADVLVTLIFGN